jgi:alpha-1,3-fucosyltransferase
MQNSKKFLLGTALILCFFSLKLFPYYTSIVTGNNVFVELGRIDEVQRHATGEETHDIKIREQTSMEMSVKNEMDRTHKNALDIIKSRTNITKTILYWTPRLGQADWAGITGKDIFRGCKYSNCQYTSNKSLLHEADILMFYCQELPYFPEVRLPHQLYVHMTREAPVNVKMNGYGMYGDDINITMSYRKDGNIHAYYFTIVAKDSVEGTYIPRIPFHQKNKSIAWMVSNCNPDSKRDLYVNELQKYIDVDIYGKCGNKTCDDPNSKNQYSSCFENFENNYKFYLSFENNICQDYYTEKLRNPLQHELVPIVFGGADYENDFPVNSLINVVDFPKPRDLAEHLKQMTEEDYHKYFQWKSSYRVDYAHDHCNLCEFLHNSAYTRGERVLPPSHGGNYSKWWHDSCHNDLIYTLKGKGGW